MTRFATMTLVGFAAMLGGCVSTDERAQQAVSEQASLPREDVSPKPAAAATMPNTQSSDSRRLLLRRSLALAIGSNRRYGLDSAIGRRRYTNAVFSGPYMEKNIFGSEIEYYCVKTTIEKLDVFGTRNVELTFQVSDGPKGKSMRGHETWTGASCTTPYEPFPELESL